LQKKKSLWKNMMRKTLKKRLCKKHRKILSLTVFNDGNISLTRLLRMREHAYSPSAALLAEFSTQSQASSSHLQLSGAVAKRQRPTTTQCHLSQRPKPEPCYHFRWEDFSLRRSNKTRRRTCTETTPRALHYLTQHCSKIGTGTFCACVCVCVWVSLSLSLSLSQKLQIWTVLNSSKLKNFFHKLLIGIGDDGCVYLWGLDFGLGIEKEKFKFFSQNFWEEWIRWWGAVFARFNGVCTRNWEKDLRETTKMGSSLSFFFFLNFGIKSLTSPSSSSSSSATLENKHG
jgi:hypothetical protein